MFTKIKEPPDDVIYFREEQRFRQVWLWTLITVLSGLLVALFAFGMYKQLYLGEPWGEEPMSDKVLWILGPFYVLLGLALFALFATSKMITEVGRDSILIKYRPFHCRYRMIPLGHIQSYRARTYRPIAEFGGWGLRFWPYLKAYNVYGNRGVELEFINGRKLMIGSQRPEEFLNAIDRAHAEIGME